MKKVPTNPPTRVPNSAHPIILLDLFLSLSLTHVHRVVWCSQRINNKHKQQQQPKKKKREMKRARARAKANKKTIEIRAKEHDVCRIHANIRIQIEME